MIGADFLQKIKLIEFNGGITYNVNGYAVLPSYTVKNILASVQPTPKSEIRFLKEGTHYADYIDILTDYPVDVDNSPGNLGDYFIYENNVYKIFSSQNFKQFSGFSTNHIETTVARDNRITYNSLTNTINLPFPEIDDSYSSLFQIIKLVSFCFTSPSLVVLWAFQQELRPNFPYCAVNIDKIENIDQTNYEAINYQSSTLYRSRNTVLYVDFDFYAYDKVQIHTLVETFKLNHEKFIYSDDKLAFLGFDGDNELDEELYENRTIFHGNVRIKFNFIIEKTETSTMTINTALASINFSN